MTTLEHPPFSSLPLRAELLQALQAVNYVEMSPVQAACAPAMLEGRDLLAQAETGSGKTATFALGILNKLDTEQFHTQALVICPTRELSEQVAAEIRRLASAIANTKVLTLCGGKPLHDQLVSLKRDPHVVVGTPGRLKKLLDMASLNIGRVDTLVLDEADRMLDMGFHDDILAILGFIDSDRQTLLFSATYPQEIVGISRAIQKNTLEVHIEKENTTDQIEQVFITATDQQKPDALLRALGKYQPDTAIIFCNRKSVCQTLYESLRQKGISARPLHGDLEQRDRDEATILFANKSLSYLIATDVAARGLDIKSLAAVINYDLSPDPATHVHRIGRTGRAGEKGIAISLVTPNETYRVEALEEYFDADMVFVELPGADKVGAQVAQPATATLQISAGKKDKIRPGDIVGALTADSGLTNDDIGKITVQAKVSFVAVDADKATRALKTLTDGRIKRQKVKARIVAS